MKNFLIGLFEPWYLKLMAYMSATGMILYGSGGDAPAAPDYTPMANASDHAAELGKELGDAQLAEAKRQYDENMKVAAPIVEEQLGLMKQSKEQGDDYYEYMKANQRPVEAKLNEEAMAAGSETKQQEMADRAQADSMQGFTKSANVMARQAARYGMSGDKFEKAGTDMTVAQAQGIAAATTAARDKEKALGYAKKMDVAGLYRNLTGASQGSYGIALNAGNAANQNQMAPGQALMSGMAQGASMQQAGAAQAIQGQAAILSSQTGIANANAQLGAGQAAGTGSMIGAGIGAAAMMI